MNYLELIGEYFPDTQAYTHGDPTVYAEIIWIDTAIPQLDLDAANLVNIKTEKIIGFSIIAKAEIESGFISSALGESHNYDSKLEDQINLIGAVTTQSTMPYSCRPSIQGSQTILLAGNKADSGATGLADDATVYTATITVDGVATPISVVGSACQLFSDLRTEIQSDLNIGTNYATIGWDNADGASGNLIVTSGMYNESSTILITDTDLFLGLSSFQSIDVAVDGSNALSTNMKLYKIHTNVELIVVINDGKDVKLAILQKFTLRKEEILTAIDETAVNAITW